MPKPRFCQVVGTVTTLLAASLALQAQTTTFTAPSGYTTITAAAAADANTPQYSFVSHSLAQERQAAAVVTSGGADTLTVAGAGWTTDEFAGTNGAHYVLITSGSSEGNIYDIEANTTDTLALAAGSGDFSSGFSDVAITIYQHNTLASVFGTDPTTGGFLGGDNASEANQILFYNNTPGGTDGYVTYYYNDEKSIFNPSEHEGWVEAADDTVAADDTIIRPNQGFIILNRSTNAFTKTVFGDVIDSDIAVRIAPDGYNLVTAPYPVDKNTTLGSSGLYPANPADYDNSIHLKAGANAGEAEKILIWNGSGYDTYFPNNYDGAPFASYHLGWVNSANQSLDASATVIPPGGFFILRHDDSAPLDWVFPNVVAP